MPTTTKFKPLYLFVLAANSLLLAGSVANKSFDSVQLLIIQWCGLCGVFIIYRFNDFIDQTHDFKFNVKRMWSNNLHKLFLLQFFLITIPAIFWFLTPLRIAILSAICILGIVYSINFKINEKNFRLKNVFLLKNLFIGILWGSQILVGANGWSSNYIFGLFIFTTIQVFIGSIIRDIPDYEVDKTEKVNSFPVVIGIKNSLVLLQFLNFISFVAAYFAERNQGFLILMAITILYRFFTLLIIRRNIHSKLWSQTFNLLTCFLIFVLSLCLFLYESYR